MERINVSTSDITNENMRYLLELFPSLETEIVDHDGSVKKAVDLVALEELIGCVADGSRERYQFTWPGKQAAKEEARKPINKTLRPILGRSVNWSDTKNLYLEGDNLDALKILRSTYAGTIKLIYIDPPYNTGHDFIYDDDYSRSKNEYAATSGDYDEYGGRLVPNPESNGRFHSDWCSMLYPRLMLARDLLANDGVIFISIDEHELCNLEKICNEIFSSSNHVGNVVVKSNPRGSMSSAELANLHEYILIYTKNRAAAEIIGHELSDAMSAEYKYEDENGKYRLLGLRMRGGFWRRTDRPNLYYPIYVNPQDCTVSLTKTAVHTEVALPVQPSTMIDGTWRWSADKVKGNEGALIGKQVMRGGDSVWDIYQKDYFDRAEGRRTKAKSIWDEPELNYQNGTNEIKELLGDSGIFDYSKPVFLLQQIIRMIKFEDEDIVLDFFSGSGTTAHAAMKQGFEDGIRRRFIMVQIDESVPEKSVSLKHGFTTICEIGEERIRRAGAKIVAEVEEANRQLKLGEEPKPVPDVGFRVLRIDSSNFTDTYATPDGYAQDQLHLFEDNVKPDRSDLDLLFQVLPTLRIPYSAAIDEIEVCGKRTFDVNHGQLVACFDVEVGADCIEEIAKMRPIYAVFRDASMADDATEANFEELFKTFSPDTVRKVI